MTTKDKGNLAVLECICKRDRTESIGSEAKVTSLLFPMMLVIIQSSRGDLTLKAMVGTHEFAYTNWMLMEPVESSHLTTDKRTVAGEYCAGQKWHNQYVST